MGDAIALGFEQFGLDGAGDSGGNLVLQGKQITKVTVEALCPQMRVGVGLDQLSADTHPFGRPAQAPFENVTYTQFTSDLLCVERLAAISERSVARNHQQIGKPVSEILLAWVAAEVVKR